jgi:RNA polymerase sigma-70 factor (ECF subfamily)
MFATRNRHPVTSLSRAIDPTDPLLSQREAPTLTAEAIFHQYAGRVCSVVRRMLSNEADVEDVTQDVLLQVVRKLDTFRGEAEVSTWLHRVSVNAALQHRRKQAPRRAHEVSTSREEMEVLGRPISSGSRWGAAPDEPILGREAEDYIKEAIRGLPAKYRDPFVLAFIEEMPHAEIGRLLGLSRPAVKSRVHRARLWLQELLGPHFEEVVR